jgi:hypothetical protein
VGGDVVTSHQRWPKSDEDVRAAKLLLGWLDDRGEHMYFDPDSRDEHEARLAIARLLRRDNPPGQLLRFIADLFDPDASYAPRRITFVHRREGTPGTSAKHWRIGLEMLQMVAGGRKVWEAKEVAVKKYGLGERQMAKIWAQFRRYLRPKT